MIFLTLPAMVALLIPVILIEGLYYRNRLQLTARQAMKASALSNSISTVAGIPVAWAAMLAVQFGAFEAISRSQTLQNWGSPLANAVFFALSAAWIAPPETAPAPWIAGATLVLLVPFFFASYLIEYRVIRWMASRPGSGLASLEPPPVRGAVRNANLLTYAAMFLATSLWLILSLPHR